MFKSVQKYSTNTLKWRKKRFSPSGIALDNIGAVEQNNNYKTYSIIIGIIVMVIVLITLWANTELFFPELNAGKEEPSTKELFRYTIESLINRSKVDLFR